MEKVTKKAKPVVKPKKTEKVKEVKDKSLKLDLDNKNNLNEVPVKKMSAKQRSLKVKAELKPLNNKVKLPKEIFAIENINNQAIFDTILSERGSRRQGTHAVKTRATVSGTGKKPWKQKGTGKARAGTLRSPVFVGGGRAFGPQVERNYNTKVNKKVRRLAFLSALTLLNNENLILVTNDIKLSKPKTSDLIKQLDNLNLLDRKHILLVTSDENIFKSANNTKVETIKVNSLSVESLLWTDALVINEEDLAILEGMLK
ncbi:MAG: 50S ribosomal protein L4 [Metamycoplasmataceae bacterium]